MANPWFKFYPSDWRADPALRVCSIAARGLWMEMLALMHEASPRGHLLVNGKSPTDAQLGALAGTSSHQITELLGELESAGVFSRTREGVIYSRRMIRDEKKGRLARKNGKNGGNPSLSKKTGNSPPVNPVDNGPDNTQKPEARSQTPEEEEARGSAPILLPGEEVRKSFARIWEKLPPQARRLGEAGGMMAFGRAVANGADPAEVERAVGPWLAASPDGIVERFDNWLQGDKWREWLPRKAGTGDVDAEIRLFAFDDDDHRRRRRWADKVGGPCPDEPGCTAPPDLLAKHGFEGRQGATA